MVAQAKRMALSPKVTRFIQSSFRSVWSLELLLLLKRDRKPWTEDEIVKAMRSSQLVVSQALESLVAAGLVSVSEAGEALYTPISEEDAKLIEETEALFARRPDTIRRLIVAASRPGLTAFADAFRLGRD
jgi:DNA-binding HxlR family transcriptional regulator